MQQLTFLFIQDYDLNYRAGMVYERMSMERGLLNDNPWQSSSPLNDRGLKALGEAIRELVNERLAMLVNEINKALAPFNVDRETVDAFIAIVEQYKDKLIKP